jgi:hypothetical protein
MYLLERQTPISARPAGFVAVVPGVAGFVPSSRLHVYLTGNALSGPILRKRRFITTYVCSQFHVGRIYRGGHGGGLKAVVQVATVRYRESSSAKPRQIPSAPVAP